jgi:hypothetical protein
MLRASNPIFTAKQDTAAVVLRLPPGLAELHHHIANISKHSTAPSIAAQLNSLPKSQS